MFQRTIYGNLTSRLPWNPYFRKHMTRVSPPVEIYFKEARRVSMQSIYENRDHCHIRPPGKTRRGMTLVEAIIALLVVFIVIMAVLMTIATSAQMIAHSREDLGGTTLAANLFEILEAQDPNKLLTPSGFMEVLERTVESFYANYTPKNPAMEYDAAGYHIAAIHSVPEDGIAEVGFIITKDGSPKSAMRYRKIINTRSNETVINIFDLPEGSD